MNHDEAKKITDDTFNEITKATSISDLQIIEDTFENKMDSVAYPRINFRIQKEEIEAIKDNFFDVNFNLANDISGKITDPLTKLLYSLVWKNGDLKKIKHIVNGIYDESEKLPDDAIVFHQFGKHLTKENHEPIIDQHVIRAFKLYRCENPENYQNCRTLKIITKKDEDDINNYKGWLLSDELKSELKEESLYMYYIDRILFALGKKIKLATSKKRL